jgi:hypothetical protein
VTSLHGSIFLFSDSQLLFWRTSQGLFFERVKAALPPSSGGCPNAAYLSASSRDATDGYELFVAALKGIGVWSHRRIPPQPSASDRAYLQETDLLFLAAGDIARGWDALRESRLAERIVERHQRGAVLVAVSAGAVQVGRKGWRGLAPTSAELFDTLGLLPYIIDVHVDPTCRRLAHLLSVMGEPGARGLGIQNGGGLIFHPGGSLEPVNHPVQELIVKDQRVERHLLAPLLSHSPTEG